MPIAMAITVRNNVMPRPRMMDSAVSHRATMGHPKFSFVTSMLTSWATRTRTTNDAAHRSGCLRRVALRTSSCVEPLGGGVAEAACTASDLVPGIRTQLPC